MLVIQIHQREAVKCKKANVLTLIRHFITLYHHQKKKCKYGTIRYFESKRSHIRIIPLL